MRRRQHSSRRQVRFIRHLLRSRCGGSCLSSEWPSQHAWAVPVCRAANTLPGTAAAAKHNLQRDPTRSIAMQHHCRECCTAAHPPRTQPGSGCRWLLLQCLPAAGTGWTWPGSQSRRSTWTAAALEAHAVI
jgi:hypothetical protein